jgi:hypothetical protein
MVDFISTPFHSGCCERSWVNRIRDAVLIDMVWSIAALRLRPYRFDGCRIWSRSAALANRAPAFRRRTAGPSRRGRAQPDADSPCTRRSTGRGRRQRCRASSAGRAQISMRRGRLALPAEVFPKESPCQSNCLSYPVQVVFIPLCMSCFCAHVSGHFCLFALLAGNYGLPC